MTKAEIIIKNVTDIDAIPRGAEWIQSDSGYSQVIIKFDRECREWYDGRADLEIKELIDSGAGYIDTVVYTDGSVVRGRNSGWEISARVGVRVCVAQSGAYPVTTTSMRMEIEAATATLRWLSNTPVIKQLSYLTHNLCYEMYRMASCGTTGYYMSPP